MADSVTHFLYLLMRDHLPVGVVTRLVNQVWEAEDLLRVFTNEQLWEIAHELRGRLGDGNGRSNS